MQANWRINNIHKEANSANDGTREVENGTFTGAEDGEHNGVRLVEIFKIFATQNEYSFFGNEPFARV